MLQVRFDIDGDAVEGDPVPDAYADRRDLVLAAAAAVDPDTDPSLASFAFDIEGGERANHPFLQVVHEATHIRAALA